MARIDQRPDLATHRAHRVAPLPHPPLLCSFTPEQQRLLLALLEAAQAAPITTSSHTPQPLSVRGTG